MKFIEFLEDFDGELRDENLRNSFSIKKMFQFYESCYTAETLEKKLYKSGKAVYIRPVLVLQLGHDRGNFVVDERKYLWREKIT